MGGKTATGKTKSRGMEFRVSFAKLIGKELESLALAQNMFTTALIREICEAYVLGKRQALEIGDNATLEDRLRTELIGLNSSLMALSGQRETAQRKLAREVRKRMHGEAESEIYVEDGEGGYRPADDWEIEQIAKNNAVPKVEDDFDWSTDDKKK